MLGRLVAERVKRFGASYPLGKIAPTIGGADLAIVNLECALTTSHRRWSGRPKAFYFGAPPEMAAALREAGVSAVTLANNHTLDFDVQGLMDTLGALDENLIQHAGAGLNLKSARRPAIVAAAGRRVGMVAYCDHQQDFAADERKPGIAFLDFHEPDRAFQIALEGLADLRAEGVDLAILGLHWGPNMAERPRRYQMEFARGAIEAGYNIVYGHSAHSFQGVEIHRGRPILYSAGDLVDDYMVNPVLRNDRQLLFDLVWMGKALERIDVHPVQIKNCKVSPAGPTTSRWIFNRCRRLCQEVGSVVRWTNSVGHISKS